MSDRPIIFSSPMVRAMLEGQKTQTRRLAKPRGSRRPSLLDGTWSDSYILDAGNAEWLAKDLPCAAGDRLYARENWRTEERNDNIKPRNLRVGIPIYYEAGGGGEEAIPACAGKLRPSIFLPRWASRLTLIVEAVRVERLQAIGYDDVLAEGCPVDPYYHDTSSDGSNPHMVSTGVARWMSPRAWYHRLWEDLHGAPSWDANPWVAAITFRVERGNIDRIAA